MLRRINESLPGLIAGIIFYGICLQLIGMWLVEDKVSYSIGLWYGVAIAIGMGYHLALAIYDAVTFDGEASNKRVVAKSMVRYIVVAILFFILGYFEFGNLIAGFLGVMGLKVSAYIQPLLQKLRRKIFPREEDFLTWEETDDLEESEVCDELKSGEVNM